MNTQAFLQIFIFLLVSILLIKPLGQYMAQVYMGKSIRFLKPMEQLIYRWSGIQPHHEMDWKEYLFAMLLFNALGFLFVFMIQMTQAYLPFNPQHFQNLNVSLAFNTAASFVTNTNWQAYSGETTMSYLTQMLALASQNFLSAATGMCILVALIRGLLNAQSGQLGNFWVDMVRGTLYLFLPLSFILALFLASQGVIQNLKPNQQVNALEITAEQTVQTIPMGPVASQVAIKQLGSNGGGFFNVNGAHPFENPTPLTNMVELLAILLLPSACCYMFGVMAGDKRQGLALLAAMYLVLLPALFVTTLSEQKGNSALRDMNIEQVAKQDLYPGGNMEGKETRFGISASTLWSVATTATSNGSTNSTLDSYTPIGGLIPLWLMQLGEVVFGGVGSGLYGMLLLVILTVFIGGLMVGRTPEYLGKKIEPFEMKMASLAVLLMPLLVLISTASSLNLSAGKSQLGNPNSHGLTEVLYAFSSMVNNNGSAFTGLNANSIFYNLLGGILMLLGRYGIAIPVLAIAGSMADKKIIPSSSGTLETHSILFVMLLIGVIILLGALSFFPVLALGPITEQLL